MRSFPEGRRLRSNPRPNARIGLTSIPALPFSLPPILFLVALFYLTFVSRLVLAPLLPLLELELGLGHGEAGSLFLAIAVGYAGGLLGSGFISARLNHRRTIALSALAVGVTLLCIAGSSSVAGLRAGLVILGLSAGLYLPSGVATLTDQVSEPHWGKALAIHEFAPNLGYITAPLLAEALLRFVSWRGVLAVLGMLAIFLGMLFWVWGCGGTRRGEPPGFETMCHLTCNPSLRIVAALFGVATGTTVGIYLMMPLFLVNEIQMHRELANTIIGLSRVSGLAAVFLSGFITDRIGRRQALVVYLTATGVLTLALGLLRGPVITPILVFFQSMASVCFFPAGLSMVSHLFAPHLRTLAVSLVMVVGFLVGAGLIPSGIGYFAEAFSFSGAICIVGLLTLAAVPLLLRINVPKKVPDAI